jgi:Mlc titration factor MtfA (ptsG expression regulator)
MFGFFKRRRRKRLLSTPFAADWLAYIQKNVPIYTRMPDADRRELQGLIQIFVAEKSFEGCGGLELTDEIKVTIAAQACLLLLHRETDVYPRLITILVYPSAFVVEASEPIGGGIMLEGKSIHLGESWSSGVVVLSWDDVRAGTSDIHDGQNLVLHEFAHQLDREDGEINGTPLLEQRSQYLAWGRVLSAEYERLQRDSRLGRASVLDHYGATDPAEFFAVATECFFEKPALLRKRHPELYDELKSFYCQDPAPLAPTKPSPTT